MDVFAVILAGGMGVRFWPRSREKQPKQLLKIFGEKSLLQQTVERLDGLIEKDHIFVITTRIQKAAIREQIPDIPKENIIDEPFGKNTAASIGLASVIIQKKCPEAITVVLPADHLIRDIKEFQRTIKTAINFAEGNSALMTIGITPDKPETDYGYIQFDENFIDSNIHKVISFAEKPPLATAERFIQAGDFLWNSGIFIWSVEAISREIKKLMPELHSGLVEISASLGKPDYQSVLVKEFGQFRSTSIDYGVMENSDEVYLVKGDFDWSDVGSWDSVFDLSEKDSEKNVRKGKVYTEKTSNCLIHTPNKFSALIGVDNLIVIETPDSLLICDRDNAGDVKHVIDYLKMNEMKDLI